MKKPEILIKGKHSLSNGLPFVLAAMAIVVAGCPHNQYIVELRPRGNVIERTLIFYREDGVDTNTGLPNYQPLEAGELAAISSRYPAQGLTNDGKRYVARGKFTNELPADVGGAGTYTHVSTSLGEAGFYVERFRGDDDLAGMTKKRFEAADQLADLFIGWSRMELGGEPGYEKLRQFLEADFRRDLKNLGAYWWEGQLASGYKTNADQELVVRFGQYILERGYFTAGEIPALWREVTEDDPQPLLRRIQQLVARKMGVPKTEPVPAALAFLADTTTMEKSFDKYLAGTALYRAEFKQWEEDKKLKPDLKRPEPSQVASDVVGKLLEFDLFGQTDHLAVRLSLPLPPVHSNGRWDDALNQVVWETNIEERTNGSHFPFFCYASWAQADQEYQEKHFGKVALAGAELTEYCLWRSSLDMQRGGEWDGFLSGLQPGSGLVERLDAFRFSGEPEQAGTNGQQEIPSHSVYPRKLLKSGLQESSLPSKEEPHLKIFGALREMMHEGKTQSHVELSTVLPGPHAYGVGALSELRGEVTVIDDIIWLSYPNEDGTARATTMKTTGEKATLFVVANVPAWRSIAITADIMAGDLDAQIERLATEKGVDITQAVPLVIKGEFSDIHWHVMNGSKAALGPAHEDHMRSAISGTIAHSSGTLVGFFSKNHQGVFTHMGSNTHFHVVLPKENVTGHVDGVTILHGAELLVPQ